MGATIDASAARTMVPEPFELETAGEAAVANLLLCKMSGLAMTSIPMPSFDYSEALWRVSVKWEGALAWFAVKCDIDHALVRVLGARLVRYPTRAAKMIASEAKWKVTTQSAALELGVSDIDTAAMPTLRRTFVRSGKRVYEIPWNEEPPARARSVAVTVVDDALVRATLGDGAKLNTAGVVHRGRVHVCGLARRVSLG